MTDVVENTSTPERGDTNAKASLAAAGGGLSAIAAHSCCVVPLVLFSLGISGAWIGRLTALAPYQPVFIAVAAVFLGYGYWLVYRRPGASCGEDEACARPAPSLIVKSVLWLATALIALAIAWPYVLPLVLD